MTYGIELSNNSQNRIISDKAYNVHYIGAATKISSVNGTGTSGFPSIKAVRLTTYRITCQTMPICFMEGGVGNYYGIVGLRDFGGEWEIIVAAFPLDSPVVHCFTQAPPGTTLSNPNDWGLAVYDANSNVAFDSAKKQLDHLYFQEISTPLCVSNNTGNFLCTGSASTTLGAMPARPAFMFASAGRAILQRPNVDEKRFLHIARINGTTVEVNWGCHYFGTSWDAYTALVEYSISPTTIIIIDASRFA